MEISVTIDDELLRRALRVTGASSEQELLETALKEHLSTEASKQLLELRGKLKWEGDTEDSWEEA